MARGGTSHMGLVHTRPNYYSRRQQVNSIINCVSVASLSFFEVASFSYFCALMAIDLFSSRIFWVWKGAPLAANPSP